MSNEKELRIERLKEEFFRLGNVPRHVAIIMDGNGRWAKARGLSVKEGHSAGVKAAKAVVKLAREAGVEVLTLYTFSVQNWKRPQFEIGALMKLLSDSAFGEVDELVREGVKVRVSGDLAGLPFAQRKALNMVISRTSAGDKLVLNLALNYGAREEILRATRRIAERASKGELTPKDIDESLFDENLYTAGLPDPDLLIRTSGELRVSNFLLWQIAYAEFYISELLWPDFDSEEFYRALVEFGKRDRRFGGREE
ncbi:MAG TPA: di-trans,poly-cis-decaprenylcistransferase [candidate division Zixibacteria bacterium]|nr:di-trans,poly-cis-decaprenylcistransferase [candidate division Zixibacteria bacterium]